MVGGRQLDVDIALTQDSARNLATNRAANKSAKPDKRNMYLSKEGVIPEGSPAWQNMSEHDRWVDGGYTGLRTWQVRGTTVQLGSSACIAEHV